MEKINIAVFPCGSEVGIEIQRAFYGDKKFKLFGLSSVDDHGRFAYAESEYTSYCGGFPHVKDPVFLGKFLYFVKENDIKLIFPAHDDAIVELAGLPGGYWGCKALCPVQWTADICRDKLETYKMFPLLAPGLPRWVEVQRGVPNTPFFAKPREGQGSKGTMKIETWEDYEFACSRGLLIMEYLPGDEYTVDCFTDRHGKLRFSQTRKRIRIKDGIAVETAPGGPDLTDWAEEISVRLHMRGAWFFQVKEDKNGNHRLLEIAPRIAGSSGIWRKCGVNLPKLTAYDALDMDVEIRFELKNITMSRTLENVFFEDGKTTYEL